MRLLSKYHFPIFLSMSLCLMFIVACQNHSNQNNKNVGKAIEEKQNDLKEIIQDNRLIILAENSATSYFIYRGQKMGFEYEVLNEFAKEIGVKLEVKFINDRDLIIEQLTEGEADIIACNLTITKNRQKEITFSHPIMRTPQVLVQRKPEGWEEMKPQEWKKELLTDPSQLSRKKIHVWQKSSYHERLLNLQQELGDTFILAPLDGSIIPEEAIEMVSNGIIDYTVVDQNVAIINQHYFPNIDTEMEISVKQKIAFGLRKDSYQLRNRLDTWLKDFENTAKFKYIYHKYFNTTTYTSKSKDEFSSLKRGKISIYDPIIKKVAKEFKWDWQLIASVIYQESKFNIHAESWAGAYGLMQFMPSVGPNYDVYPDSPPEVQIRGGMKKLLVNYNQWASIKDTTQRLKFALATYNTGLGHVLDAQRLAEKYGKDPFEWDGNVEEYMSLLSVPKYYKDPSVFYGYARGSETYKYVREVIARFGEFKAVYDKSL